MTKTLTPYQQKLLDPRWQKKRLEILNRDNWACTNCGRTDLNLQVHHEFYSGNPWDIDNSKLKTLCHVCHEGKHIRVPEVKYMPKHTGPVFLIEASDIDLDFDTVNNIPFTIKALCDIIYRAKTNPEDWVKKYPLGIEHYIFSYEYKLNQYCLKENILLKWNGTDFGIGDETKLVINE